MGKHLKQLLAGARAVLVIRPGGDYVRPARGDTRQDVERLSGDARRVAADLNGVTLSYGQQVHYRKG